MQVVQASFAASLNLDMSDIGFVDLHVQNQYGHVSNEYHLQASVDDLQSVCLFIEDYDLSFPRQICPHFSYIS